MYRAIDVSNFTGKIAPLHGPEFRDNARLLIANTQDVDIAAQQCVLALENCMAYELYSQQYLTVEIDRELEKAFRIQELVGEPADRLWLALEEDIVEVYSDADGQGLLPSIDVMHSWVERMITEASNHFDLGIYTRRSWWATYMRNTDWFADHHGLPLWDADYDGVAELEPFTQYGGWEGRLMKQYAQNVGFIQYNVDLNVRAS